MKCQDCNAQVELGSSFCPNCGAKLSLLNEAKSPEEVSCDWLKKILEQIEYKIQVSQEDKNTVVGIHEKWGFLSLYLRRDIGLIVVTTTFRMKKPRWGKRSEELMDLNKANGMALICKFFLNEKTETLTAYSFIQLKDSLTGRDIITLLEKFNREVWSTLRNSGILAFAEIDTLTQFLGNRDKR